MASTHCSLQDPNITPNLTSLSRSQLARTLSAVFASQLFSRSVASLLSVVECCTRLFLTLSLPTHASDACFYAISLSNIARATRPRLFAFSANTIYCLRVETRRIRKSSLK